MDGESTDQSQKQALSRCALARDTEAKLESLRESCKKACCTRTEPEGGETTKVPRTFRQILGSEVDALFWCDHSFPESRHTETSSLTATKQFMHGQKQGLNLHHFDPRVMDEYRCKDLYSTNKTAFVLLPMIRQIGAWFVCIIATMVTTKFFG